MIQYQEKPFYLNDEDIHWVEHTLASMTLEEKIGQLFCVTDMITDPEALKAFVQKYHIGGFPTGGFGESDNIAIPLKEALERAGFTVSLYDYATMERARFLPPVFRICRRNLTCQSWRQMSPPAPTIPPVGWTGSH